jgi:hypothetical protein
MEGQWQRQLYICCSISDKSARRRTCSGSGDANSTFAAAAAAGVDAPVA